MLQLKTINSATCALLQQMSAMAAMSEFSLAGGTALALQLGHRISIDLDFFTLNTFDTEEIFELLENEFQVSNCTHGQNAISLFVMYQGMEIKLDMLRHRYPLLKTVQQIDNIRLYSMEDIAAMKLNAIANRGAKKDFYDIYALLKYYSLQELLLLFEKKYHQLNSYTVTKSLVYFVDADQEPDPVSLANVSWDEIKAQFKDMVPGL